MPCTLLLTATITPPPGVSMLVRADPAVRFRDYAQALEFYLQIPDRFLERIVLVDNSNSDVTGLREIADRLKGGKEVHITSFDGLDHPPAFGRGYGEMKLMDWALGESGPIARLPAKTVVWKGTGRYKLANMARMIASMPRSFELYCDLKDRPHRWFDRRFFAFTKGWYDRHLRGRYRGLREDLGDGDGEPGSSVPEVVLRRYLDQHLDEPGIVPRFRVEPYIDGIRSFDTRSFVSPRNLYKCWVRRASRAVAPGFWI